MEDNAAIYKAAVIMLTFEEKGIELNWEGVKEIHNKNEPALIKLQGRREEEMNQLWIC